MLVSSASSGQRSGLETPPARPGPARPGLACRPRDRQIPSTFISHSSSLLSLSLLLLLSPSFPQRFSALARRAEDCPTFILASYITVFPSQPRSVMGGRPTRRVKAPPLSLSLSFSLYLISPTPFLSHLLMFAAAPVLPRRGSLTS